MVRHYDPQVLSSKPENAAWLRNNPSFFLWTQPESQQKSGRLTPNKSGISPSGPPGKSGNSATEAYAENASMLCIKDYLVNDLFFQLFAEAWLSHILDVSIGLVRWHLIPGYWTIAEAVVRSVITTPTTPQSVKLESLLFLNPAILNGPILGILTRRCLEETSVYALQSVNRSLSTIDSWLRRLGRPARRRQPPQSSRATSHTAGAGGEARGTSLISEPAPNPHDLDVMASPLPSSFCFHQFFTALFILIDQPHFQVLIKALTFIYMHCGRFYGMHRRYLMDQLIFKPDRFYRLFFHWCPQVRQAYQYIIVYRLVRTSGGLKTIPEWIRHQKLSKRASALSLSGRSDLPLDAILPPPEWGDMSHPIANNSNHEAQPAPAPRETMSEKLHMWLSPRNTAKNTPPLVHNPSPAAPPDLHLAPQHPRSEEPSGSSSSSTSGTSSLEAASEKIHPQLKAAALAQQQQQQQQPQQQNHSKSSHASAADPQDNSTVNKDNKDNNSKTNSKPRRRSAVAGAPKRLSLTFGRTIEKDKEKEKEKEKEKDKEKEKEKEGKEEKDVLGEPPSPKSKEKKQRSPRLSLTRGLLGTRDPPSSAHKTETAAASGGPGAPPERVSSGPGGAPGSAGGAATPSAISSHGVPRSPAKKTASSKLVAGLRKLSMVLAFKSHRREKPSASVHADNTGAGRRNTTQNTVDPLTLMEPGDPDFTKCVVVATLMSKEERALDDMYVGRFAATMKYILSELVPATHSSPRTPSLLLPPKHDQASAAKPQLGPTHLLEELPLDIPPFPPELRPYAATALQEFDSDLQSFRRLQKAHSVSGSFRHPDTLTGGPRKILRQERKRRRTRRRHSIHNLDINQPDVSRGRRRSSSDAGLHLDAKKRERAHTASAGLSREAHTRDPSHGRSLSPPGPGSTSHGQPGHDSDLEASNHLDSSSSSSSSSTTSSSSSDNPPSVLQNVASSAIPPVIRGEVRIPVLYFDIPTLSAASGVS